MEVLDLKNANIKNENKEKKLREHKIVALEGGKKDTSEVGILKVDGEEFELASFVLSGESTTGSRLLFSFNVSLEEMITYSRILDIVVSEKVKNAINE